MTLLPSGQLQTSNVQGDEKNNNHKSREQGKQDKKQTIVIYLFIIQTLK